ncbi:M66 family metalloprotease [Vibrio parahaemolyticus]
MKKKCLAMTIGWILCLPSIASEVDSTTVYFNQNNFKSDTVGNLPATVQFVQNSIMPSKHKILNDVHPHLVSERKLMVLFQPKDALQADIVATAKDSQGNIVYQGRMKPPSELPKVAGQTGSTQPIEKPSTHEKVITDNQTIRAFAEDKDGSYFSEVFTEHDTLHIAISNGNWAKNFYLPNGKVHHGKTITFTSNAGWNSNVYYSHGSLKLQRGGEYTLQNIDGLWFTQADTEFNKVKYSQNTYSVIIPANKVKPGLTFSFTDGEKVGELGGFKVGAPNELIIHTIDLGLLMAPRDQFSFQSNQDLHQEYFQQLPISQLTVSEYEPQHFTEVMLPNGQLLTDFDPSDGGVYKGTMRQQIAKVLISHGIDNANYGISSSGGVKESWHPYTSAQLTAHNAVGYYANGIQVHGLSGGNGMVTLRSSTGNEFSHELGHNFGLGHYPGGFSGAVNGSADKVNSTWGWDAHENYFLPNFEKRPSGGDTCYNDQCMSPFEGHRFGKGAMSGGQPLYSKHNSYTLHTPYELNKIQNFFENKAIFTPTSPSGFTRWDEDLNQMVTWKNMLRDNLSTSSTVTKEQKPYKQGVAVTTLVGFYDPQRALNSYIYPALHGSFGSVYDDALSSSSCQLNVHTQKGGTKTFNLYSRRLDSGYMNKFHVNVETDLEPYSTELYCDGNLLASRSLEKPQKELKTSIVTTKEEPKGCIVNIDSGEEYCLPVGESAGYSLPDSFYNKPVYINAQLGTAVELSDWSNLSYNRVATFVGTVEHSQLKKVLAKNGEELDLSHPRSMRVVKTDKEVGCIVSIDTQQEYCLPKGKRSRYVLPKFILEHDIYIKNAPTTSIVLSDWANLSYNRLATFSDTVSHFDLKDVKAHNGRYIDFSHPRSMRVN